jgi:hypothetical protein
MLMLCYSFRLMSLLFLLLDTPTLLLFLLNVIALRLFLLDAVVTPLARDYYCFLIDTIAPLVECCCSLFIEVSLFCTCDILVRCSLVNVVAFAPLVSDWYFPSLVFASVGRVVQIQVL